MNKAEKQAWNEGRARITELEAEVVRLKGITSENWDDLQANITEKQAWRKIIRELRAENVKLHKELEEKTKEVEYLQKLRDSLW